jgi:hypothetical protein
METAALETEARETRPWPPRRVASVLVGLVVLGVAMTGANSGWSNYQDHRATEASCAALDRPVSGIETLSWSNGVTVTEADWATLLTTWHEHLGQDEQHRVTGALRFVVVAGGADALFHDVDDEVRPAVDYLYTTIKRPSTPDAHDARALAYVDDLERYLIDTCGVAP